MGLGELVLCADDENVRARVADEIRTAGAAILRVEQRAPRRPVVESQDGVLPLRTRIHEHVILVEPRRIVEKARNDRHRAELVTAEELDSFGVKDLAHEWATRFDTLESRNVAVALLREHGAQS